MKIKAPNARAEIVGTKLVATRDSETHLIEIHAVTIAGSGEVLHMDLLRSLKVPKGDFLVAKVTKPGDENPLWSFKTEGYPGLGKIYHDQQTDEYLILLVNPRPDPRHPVLERIIPLLDLIKATRSKVGEAGDIVYVGGKYSPPRLVEIKERIARELRIGCALTRFEQGIREVMRQRQAKQEAAEEADRLAKILAQKEERNTHRQSIIDRPTITVYTAGGEKRWGIPVVGDDWKMLRNNLGVVLVEEYPAELLVPIEAFFVEKAKGSGRCGKRNAQPVTFERPVRQAADSQPDPSFIGTFLGRKFDKEQQDLVDDEVLILQADKKNFDLLKEKRQNGGTLVTLDAEPNERGRYQVHCFSSGGVQIAGEYVLTAQL